MANFYLDVQTISRGKGRSVTRLANYISGQNLHDSYNNKTYSHHRQDILFCQIFLPDGAPPTFYDMQELCNKIDGAERRYDARTARQLIGSLPNELSPGELNRIVREFIENNFVSYGLCAIAAIHEGRNVDEPSRNNPHVHVVVPTRTVGPNGFSTKKDREHDRREYIGIWREQWALVQNLAYERNRLDIRVSHESLKVQGIHNREPTIHISCAAWQMEKRGEHTPSGDQKRKIAARNKEKELERQQELERERNLDIEFEL